MTVLPKTQNYPHIVEFVVKDLHNALAVCSKSTTGKERAAIFQFTGQQAIIHVGTHNHAVIQTLTAAAKPQVVTFQLDVLLPVLNSLSGSVVGIELGERFSILTCDQFQMQLDHVDVLADLTRFEPIVLKDDTTGQFQVDTRELVTAVTRVAFAIIQEEYATAMACVQITAPEGHMVTAGACEWKMAKYETRQPMPDVELKPLAKALVPIVQSLDVSLPTTITHDHARVVLENGSTRFVCPQTEGRYPRWQNTLKYKSPNVERGDPEFSVTMGVSGLGKMLNRMKNVTEQDNAYRVGWMFDESTMTSVGFDGQGIQKAKETYNTEQPTGELELTSLNFSLNHVKEGLKDMAGTVTMEAWNTANVVFFVDDADPAFTAYIPRLT